MEKYSYTLVDENINDLFYFARVGVRFVFCWGVEGYGGGMKKPVKS
jgi:hypothetical protein